MQEWFNNLDVKNILQELDKIKGYSDYNFNIVYLSIERAEKIAKNETLYFNSNASKRELNKVNRKDVDFHRFVVELWHDISSLGLSLKNKKGNAK